MPHRLYSAISFSNVICAALVIVVSNPSHAAEEIVERCGLGAAPDSPNFVSYNEGRERIRAKLGYEPVCEENIPTLPPAFSLEPFDIVRGKLAFEPIPLDGTPFAAYRLLGARPDITGAKRGASALRRYFAGPAGEALELFEWDQSLGGATYVLDPKRYSERVKGHPAMLTIAQSKNGKAFTSVIWEENRRHLELSINRNVRTEGFAQFMHLADSLPPPSAAEPNAPVLEDVLPPPFGPNVPFLQKPPT